jgi:hypothetical protein
MSQHPNKLALNLVFIIEHFACSKLLTGTLKAACIKGFRGFNMLVNICVNIRLSLSKDANILVSLLSVVAVFIHTIISGQDFRKNSSDPIGVQAIEPLFNSFTSPILLTT